MEQEPISADFAKEYIGGIGFNVARLFHLVKPKIDALGPENIIMFGVGPLCGTLYPGAARLTITAKSPETDIFGSTNIGGHFAAELKYAGYDQVCVAGQSPQPVYLWIDDDRAELRDAGHLWGKSSWETGSVIREELADLEIQVLCIGPAGENLVRFASVINPPRGAAGRTGMGAVMGSKRLKAIAVRGTKPVKVARPEEFLRLCQASTIFGRSEPRYKVLRKGGSANWLDFAAPKGGLGRRNYQSTRFPNWRALSAERFVPGGEFTVRKRGCFSCPIGCAGFFNVRTGEFAQTFGRVPEYGMTSIGVRCDIDQLEPILRMQSLFDEFGIDATSGGGMIAWAMDCYNRGLLSREETDGISLEWGDYAAVLELVPRIARRQGFLGNLLAEGEKRAPQILGKASDKFLYHIKGLYAATYDPRADKVFGLSCFIAPRGADHLTANILWIPDLLRDTDLGKELAKKFRECLALPSESRDANLKGLGTAFKLCEDRSTLLNAIEVCTRTGGSFELLRQALAAATGVEFGMNDLVRAGERIFNIEKAFNSREGLTREDDNISVPEKFMGEALSEGPYKGDVLNLKPVLDEYYQARGWDVTTGLQTRQTLQELGLADMVPELESLGALQ
ncbi:MAG: aldehyde ferredoxin oxidoreductase family protein [Chloroflexi bacterium]|nr:aldehyde ferredoxin oxidoreductase family protein [Chloroflexota bacterium]